MAGIDVFKRATRHVDARAHSGDEPGQLELPDALGNPPNNGAGLVVVYVRSVEGRLHDTGEHRRPHAGPATSAMSSVARPGPDAA